MTYSALYDIQREYDEKTGYAAQRKYISSSVRRFVINLTHVDQDIIDKLDSVSNKTDYIRQLIKADIEKM